MQYITVDENLIKAMLATQFEEFDKGWRAKEIM